MVKLEDFAVGEIRKMISKYNKQVKLGGYSKMKKEELIKFVRNHDNLKVVENEKGVNISVKAGSVEAEKKAVKEKKAPPAEKKTLTREEMRKSTKTIINKKKYPDNMTDADFESMKKDAEKILKQKIPLAVIKEAHERKLADKKKKKAPAPAPAPAPKKAPKEKKAPAPKGKAEAPSTKYDYNKNKMIQTTTKSKRIV